MIAAIGLQVVLLLAVVVAACRDFSWTATLRGPGGEVGDRSEFAAEFDDALRKRVYLLRGLGRLSAASMMLAVVFELSWGISGGSGLVALQAGLPQRIAVRNVTVSVALGVVTLANLLWVERGVRRLGREALRRMRAPG